jgi:hypothetical protein
MGKPKHSDDPRGEQKGAQAHGEGQHGPKAFEARKAEINDHGQERGGQPGRSERAQNDPRSADGSDAHLHEDKLADPHQERDGGHRLFENRLQHDEAEKNSEKNRAMIDVDRHKHDREQFQVPHGRESHPAVPQTGPEHTMKTGGQGGGNRSREELGDTGHS